MNKMTYIQSLRYDLPTILSPASVFNRIICIFELAPPGADASTFSTLFHTLNTDPLRTWNVRDLSPTSHCKPTAIFLQFPFLQKIKILNYLTARILKDINIKLSNC